MRPYHHLALETSSLRNKKGTEVHLSYDQSLAGLAKKHLRHLRPVEAFSLLIDSLEGRLRTYQRDIPFRDTADDMHRSWGEWLSLAIERQEDYIRCYLDPAGLKFKSGWGTTPRYDATSFRYTCQWRFPLPEVSRGVVQLGLDELGDEFAECMTGRRWQDLPEQMREGGTRVEVVLPPVGVIWPVSRTLGRYTLNANTYRAASRGAVEIADLSGRKPIAPIRLRLVT